MIKLFLKGKHTDMNLLGRKESASKKPDLKLRKGNPCKLQ